VEGCGRQIGAFGPTSRFARLVLDESRHALLLGGGVPRAAEGSNGGGRSGGGSADKRALRLGALQFCNQF
jgi:hypothetical protein